MFRPLCRSSAIVFLLNDCFCLAGVTSLLVERLRRPWFYFYWRRQWVCGLLREKHFVALWKSVTARSGGPLPLRVVDIIMYNLCLLTEKNTNLFYFIFNNLNCMQTYYFTSLVKHQIIYFLASKKAMGFLVLKMPSAGRSPKSCGLDGPKLGLSRAHS